MCLIGTKKWCWNVLICVLNVQTPMYSSSFEQFFFFFLLSGIQLLKILNILGTVCKKQQLSEHANRYFLISRKSCSQNLLLSKLKWLAAKNTRESPSILLFHSFFSFSRTLYHWCCVNNLNVTFNSSAKYVTFYHRMMQSVLLACIDVVCEVWNIVW